MSIRVFRGKIEAGSMKTIFIYDGVDLTRGWRVIHMDVTDYSAPSASTSSGVILHTNEVRQIRFMIEDNQTIGMGWYDGAGAGLQLQLDPNHTIVTTLYASNIDTNPANYMIIMEEISLNASENIIYQLKEQAQS